MLSDQQQQYAGEFTSPGGFIFGLQGWTWGDQKPTSITFFLNGTVKVSDQYGRPIKGAVPPDGNPVYFDRCNHAQLVDALAGEGIDVVAEMNKAGTPCKQCKGVKYVNNKWCQTCYHKESGESTGLCPSIKCSGWPQLPYDALKKLKELPPTPIEDLRKIKDADMRRDALKTRREADAVREKEMQSVDDE